MRLRRGIADAAGCSHRASAMGNPLRRAAGRRALRVRWGVPKGSGGWVTASSKIAVQAGDARGPLTLGRFAPFVRGTEPGTAVFIHVEVRAGHGGPVQNRRSGWGREGTAHFRRLTPPSFAAQNPLQGGGEVSGALGGSIRAVRALQPRLFKRPRRATSGTHCGVTQPARRVPLKVMVRRQTGGERAVVFLSAFVRVTRNLAFPPTEAARSVSPGNPW
jgi:hypothetical protein